jgi:hypothetical protein
VNVVTGNVLPMINGATAVFRLDAPVPAGDDPFRAREGETQAAFTRLTMDEGEALLALFTRAGDGAASGTAAAA